MLLRDLVLVIVAAVKGVPNHLRVNRIGVDSEQNAYFSAPGPDNTKATSAPFPEAADADRS